MNYLKTYCNLIRKAEQRGYTKKKAKEQGLYVEGHHTFPKSIFGKTKTEEHKKKIKLSNCKYVYTFISPEEIITETVWYTDFCKENNLNHCKIREVTRGVRNHHKGWKATRRPRTNEDK